MLKPKSKSRPWQIDRQVVRPMQDRPRNEFYHTSRWKKESRAFRKQNPLCKRCRMKGFVVPSEVVDHIKPLLVCEDPWDKNNWQGLCKKCNNSKAAEDKIQISNHKKTLKNEIIQIRK